MLRKDSAPWSELYNKTSDIKLVFLYSTIKMVHGPINIRLIVCRKIVRYQNLMQIRLVGAEVFHAEGRTDGRDVSNCSCFVILRTYFNSRGCVPPENGGRFAACIVTMS